jgi:hypothetical protein
MKQVRQGDVFLQKGVLPAGAKKHRKSGPIILAHGEVTGHCHQILDFDSVDMYTDEKGETWVSSDKPFTLVHDEHGPVTFEPGCYNVSRQREYDVFEERQERQVAD